MGLRVARVALFESRECGDARHTHQPDTGGQVHGTSKAVRAGARAQRSNPAGRIAAALSDRGVAGVATHAATAAAAMAGGARGRARGVFCAGASTWATRLE